jgi:methionyl-tRNA formyltransferase
VIVTRILPVALGFHAAVEDAGHTPVGLLTVRDTSGRYGGFDLGAQLNELPGDLDVLMPATRARIAPLLASLEPDIVVCMGFPWKVPAEALAVPRLGWINGHPSLLPRHRGPVPVAWAIRCGDEEYGVTFHRMEPDFDTGPVLAQRPLPIGEYCEPEAFYARMGPVVMDVLADALAALARGDEGTVQTGGDYEGFFTDADAYLDPARPADELHRLVWAWRYTIPKGDLHGALAVVDGATVRVLASSLTETEGALAFDCVDGPLWLVTTEPAPERPTAPARR